MSHKSNKLPKTETWLWLQPSCEQLILRLQHETQNDEDENVHLVELMFGQQILDSTDYRPKTPVPIVIYDSNN